VKIGSSAIGCGVIPETANKITPLSLECILLIILQEKSELNKEKKIII
jgi:hypothetical protein